MRLLLSVAALAFQIAALSPADRAAVVQQLSAQDLADVYNALRYDWKVWARPEQLPPPEPWRYWYLPGGRGSGKTRPAAELVIEWAKVPETRIALVGRDAGTCRKVMVDGESGIMACSPPWFRPRYLPSLKRLVWPNGSVGELHSANEPETTRGPQYHKAWIEELFHWKIPPRMTEPVAWKEGIRYGVRLGQNPQTIVTSTPRSSEFCYDLLLGKKDLVTGERNVRQLPEDHPDRYAPDGFPRQWTHEFTVDVDGIPVRSVAWVTRWPTEANRANLSPGLPEEWRHEFGASRIGKQELDGAILLRAQGALWSTALFDQTRVDSVPRLVKVVVAVDPTRSDEPTDDCGIVVGGLGEDGHAYIWDDATVKGDPLTWARAAVSAANKNSAVGIVYEANRLEATTRDTIRSVDPSMKWIPVRATEGKNARAEPVSALYHQGKVHHVTDPRDPKKLARLEDEMIAWDPKGRMPSPNRLDADVWLVTALLLGEDKPEFRLL